MKIMVPCAVCSIEIKCSPNRKASARQPVCHSCRRKIKKSERPKIANCKVCNCEVTTPAGQKGTLRRFCNEHVNLKEGFCQACETQSWKTHPNNKRCIKCVRAGIPVAERYQKQCQHPGCAEKHNAKGYCKQHYNQLVLKKQDYSKVVRSMVSATCNGCGITFQRSTKAARKYCTKECAYKYRPTWQLGDMKRTNRPVGRRKTLMIQYCEWCDQQFEATNKRRFCNKECQHLWHRDNAKPGVSTPRSPLAVALEDHNYDTVIAEVYKKSILTLDGCWEWPTTDKGGYARFQGRSLYRAILEAKEQAPLGSQAAHHKCGNSACVNPEHLQPVTHAENSAEMLQRNAYLRRINELEGALRSISPAHPVLNRIPLGQQRLNSA